MTESDEKIHKNIFSLKGSYRHVEGSFDNLIKKTFDKKPKTIRYRFEKKF